MVGLRRIRHQLVRRPILMVCAAVEEQIPLPLVAGLEPQPAARPLSLSHLGHLAERQTQPSLPKLGEC